MIVIAGVAIMAVGAWVMPMYNAQLAHDDAQQIQNSVKDVKAVVGSVEDGLTGGKDLGKQNIVGLIASGKEKTELTSLFGDDFDTFNSAFLGTQKKSGAGVAGVEFKTFNTPLPRSFLPNTLAPADIIESDAGTCTSDGTLLGSAANTPQQVLGFAITDRTAAANLVRIQVCASTGPLSGTIIIDEMVSVSAQNVLFTKNFDFGVVPPGSALRVLITTETDTADTFDFWLLIGDPQGGKEIPTMQGLTGNPCNGVSVTVKNPAGNAALGVGTATVELSHSFIPFHDSKPIDNNGQAIFPGPLPPGDYFIDVFPTSSTQFPVFSDVTCNAAAPGSALTNKDVNIKDASALATGGTATLTVKVVDQNGAPLLKTGSFVDHASAPIINDVCNDGNSGARTPNDGTICQAISEGDTIFGNAVLTDTNTGQFSIASLPLGNYFINTCTSTFKCGAVEANLVSGGTTVIMEIFVN